MQIAWVDTLVEYPIYGNLTESPLFNSSYDVSLPLAFVYLREFVRHHRPDVEFKYIPSRLYAAEGLSLDLEGELEHADLVVTSTSTADSGSAKEILSRAKAMGKKTAIGGPFARFSPHRILDWGCVDFCVTGEGETPFLQLVEYLFYGVSPPASWAGVVTPDLPTSRKAPVCDLATLPQPHYDELPIRGFQRYMRSAYILSTRGCPAPCHFCTSARIYGYSYRVRPIESVLEEIEELHQLGFKNISLADDTVAVNREWALRLFRLLAKRNPGVKFKVRSRADELDELLVDEMSAAGVEIVQFGVESISLSVRASMHKALDREAIDRAFELVLRTAALKANPLYMLGYIGETPDDLARNGCFIKEVGVDPRVITYVSFTTPYPDTGFAGLCRKNNGCVVTHDLKYYTNKFPVFLPRTLCEDSNAAGLERLVATYDDIARAVNTSHHTQYPIAQGFFDDIVISGLEPY
jgi:anaerobic magnesium-protoporphyrin IX monomethyl ester cyclase